MNLCLDLLTKNQFVHSSVLYRKSKIMECKRFNIYSSPFEDYDLILRIGRKYKVGNLNLDAVAYRDHSEGESKKISFFLKIIFLIILMTVKKFWAPFTR